MTERLESVGPNDRTIGWMLLALSLGCAGFWAWLLVRPEDRIRFHGSDAEAALMAFALPDLVLPILGSGLVWSLHRRSPRVASRLSMLTAGGLIYAALHCAALTALTGRGVLATVLMIPAAGWALMLAIRLERRLEERAP